MTIAQLKAQLAAINCTMRHSDGEIRVNLRGADEAVAYYTNDRDDALATGREMRRIADANVAEALGLKPVTEADRFVVAKLDFRPVANFLTK